MYERPSNSEIYRSIDPSLKGKARGRAYYEARHALTEKARALEQLELELKRLELREKKKELIRRQDALKFKLHVAKERERLGLDGST